MTMKDARSDMIAPKRSYGRSVPAWRGSVSAAALPRIIVRDGHADTAAFAMPKPSDCRHPRASDQDEGE
jgi:hypothetical protein